MKLPWSLILLCPFIIVLVSCSDIKVRATGHEDEILVFSDDSTWNALHPLLKRVFLDTVYTPQPEIWFSLKRISFSEFDRYLTHMNRIVAAPLDGTGPVAALMRQSLDQRVQALVSEGKEFVFNKYDPHARGQILMYLAGVDLPSLRSSIEASAPDLLYYFKKMSLRRELTSVASERAYHKKDIERSLLKSYDWTMTIQHDYVVAKESAEDRFFWVRRATPSDMERWIFVSWEDVRDPRLLTSNYVIEQRNRLTKAHLKTVDDGAYVEIAPYYLEVQNVNFLGRFGFESRGNWRFSDKSGGGPFVNYTFYDEPSRRIYVLDGSIFAPRVEKKKLILQVDALLHTFKTLNDLNEQERRALGHEGEKSRKTS